MRIHPTLTRQCWLFAVGSTFFAVATAPRFAMLAGAGAANLLCFLGSWFFTTAGWMQLKLSAGTSMDQWSSAAVQFAGTILFNISTGGALWMQSIGWRQHLVWTPDAVGSLAFLISGLLALAALTIGSARRDRVDAWLNMVGCLAFGASAVGAFIRRSGVTEDAWLANLGTFIGALCFLAAALLGLPRFRDRGRSLRQSAA
ncbi:MAG: YrhK family protein [Mycobacterium sp.]|nr:YrhK family protein [Mycobacterium sp.]